MKLKELKEIVDAKVLYGEFNLEKEVSSFYASDLMSDILATAKESGILITAMVQPQVIRTVQMLDLIAIIFVGGKCPPEETLRLAREAEIPILVTKYSMFETCGKIYMRINETDRKGIL
ncbi:MAG: DRTGG domain-containing protein [bacterium]